MPLSRSQPHRGFARSAGGSGQLPFKSRITGVGGWGDVLSLSHWLSIPFAELEIGAKHFVGVAPVPQPDHW